MLLPLAGVRLLLPFFVVVVLDSIRPAASGALSLIRAPEHPLPYPTLPESIEGCTVHHAAIKIAGVASLFRIVFPRTNKHRSIRGIPCKDLERGVRSLPCASAPSPTGIVDPEGS